MRDRYDYDTGGGGEARGAPAAAAGGACKPGGKDSKYRTQRVREASL